MRNELNTKTTFKLESKTIPVSIEPQSYYAIDTGIKQPDGYRTFSYVIFGNQNRMASFDISSGIMNVYNQGGSAWSADITISVFFQPI